MTGALKSQFGESPFTILDAMTGEWQEEKHRWLALGIQSEVRRGKNLLGFSPTILQGDGGTSVFDPVLCDIIYKWFAVSGGQVIDPFAGGSVRGIVAGCAGLSYWGCELRPEQVEANREQATKIDSKHPGTLIQMPQWVDGDSAIMLDQAPETDFLFSCPPYGDLEKYSDDPRDLSNMSHADFLVAYRTIVAKAVAKLRDDSFACFVVGDYRDKEGYLSNFVCETIHAFKVAGARLYNHAILRTQIGSAAIRAGGTFNAYRKLIAVHQNVLIFCKGDAKKAAAKAKRLEGHD